MRRLVEERIRQRRRDKGALPSVRELAAEFGASPRTVHLALRDLEREGVVHAIARKGFFWGTPEPVEATRPASTEENFATRFLEDLRRGTYHPWKALPAPKMLAQVYGVGVRSVRRVVEQLSAGGILETRGREAFLATPARKAPGTSVLVVVRCDEHGAFLLDTEREIDFLKSVRKELDEQGLGMIRVGYCEQAGGAFLDSAGRGIDPSHLRVPVLGAIVSTWLVHDPLLLLERLEPLGLPLSVWWEHATGNFPRRRFRAGIAGFNLSFGESAGTAVGRFLTSRGLLEAAFVSPYHGNDWSPARLRGLEQHLLACGGAVRAFVDPEYYSPWDLQRRSGEHSGGSRLMDRILGGFLRDHALLDTPTWVVVNDHAAAAVHRLLREHGGPEPLLVGFDNTSESERLGFDSFEFHTDGMVRQMLLHLARPMAALFRGDPIHEMIGRMVVRSAIRPRDAGHPP